MSAESGISTFRDAGGLWDQYPVEQVATPEGYAANPKLVIDFYNERRKQLLAVKPNRGHELVSEMEKFFNVTVITQNIDNLHERAGSSHIIHLHGELTKVTSSWQVGTYGANHKRRAYHQRNSCNRIRFINKIRAIR